MKFLITLLTLNVFIVKAQVSIIINDTILTHKSSVSVLEGDRVVLESKKAGVCVRLLPDLKEYDNLEDRLNTIKKINYRFQKLGNDSMPAKINLPPLNAGTYYFGFFEDTSQVLLSNKPIHLEYDNIVQVVVRRDDSYVGMLTELLDLPFIIPPKLIKGYGHQTDLCIGTDCAELAIYGMRRLGYQIPFCGPKLIYKYLREVTEVRSGTILHFGFQVSVVYEDRGIKGKLDKEDLLIHAFENKVSIQPLGDTKLKGLPVKLYEWNIKN